MSAGQDFNQTCEVWCGLNMAWQNMTYPVANRWCYYYNRIMGFRCVQDSYQTCEVWGRSYIVCLSYNKFLFYGKTSKFVRLPWTRPSTKTQYLPNLTSQRALDYTYQIWCRSVWISRRRLFKYNAWKWQKTFSSPSLQNKDPGGGVGSTYRGGDC